MDVLDLLHLAERVDPDAELEALVAGLPAAAPKSAVAPATRTACGLCGNPATARCLRCERAACARHHRMMFGLCSDCAPHPTEPDGPPGGLDIPWIG